MTGTSNSLMRAMRLTPPKITASVAAVHTTPVSQGDRPKLLCSASAIVLACTELKASAKVTVMSTAKVTAQAR